jgi:hypothetical protein
MLVRFLLVIILLLINVSVYAKDLYQLKNIDLDTADFYLFDLYDGQIQLARAIDAYYHDGRYFVAITPILETLLLKYKSSNSQLDVDFDDKDLTFYFIGNVETDKSGSGQWFRDEIYTYLDIDVISQILGTDIEISTAFLRMKIQPHSFNFPYQIIEQQQNKRSFNQFSQWSGSADKDVLTEQIITIPDTYRLLTMPTGYLKLDYAATKYNENYLSTFQSISDIAYHSANVTITDNETETASRVTLSRYPQYAGDKILGVWDTYTIGDIFSQKNQLDNQSVTTRGLGLSFSANKKSLHRENMSTSITKDAPPGWEADLYRNGNFITTTTVPADGLLVFNDLEVFYGKNNFKISLYGPYGEEKQLNEYIDVRKNPLSEGDISYQLSLKDNDNSLLSMDLTDLNIDSINAGFGYGIYDSWQFGLNVSNNSSANGERFTSARFRNLISLQNFLFENNLVIDQNNNYQQITTLSTSIIKNDSFITQYKFGGGDNNASLGNEETLSFNYNISFDRFLWGLSYQKSFDFNTQIAKLNTSVSFGGLNFTNTLTYNDIKFVDEELKLQGNFNIAGRVTKDFRIIASVPYLPEFGGIDKENTAINFSYRIRDSFENDHNFSLITSSIGKDNRWSLRYNVAWTKPSHQLLFGAGASSNDNWNLRAGVSFYFGYDHHNRRPIISSKNILSVGAMDIHAYLDRQMNGIPDVLDYNLEGVRFLGNKNWESFETNEQGKVHLIGANPGVNKLTAQWQDGTNTIRNDYLLYSHPGSLSKVNLPFYLTTEIETFVVLNINGVLLPLRNANVRLVNHSLSKEQIIRTDEDGYLFSTGLIPGYYSIIVESDYLRSKGFTSNVIGYQFKTPSGGGFIVIPAIILTREDGVKLPESVAILELTQDNFEQIVDVDNQELIHLPPKGAFETPLSIENLSIEYQTSKAYIENSYNQRFAKNYKQNAKANVEEPPKRRIETGKVNPIPKVVNELSVVANVVNVALYVGDYITFANAVEASVALNKQEVEVIERTSANGRIIYRIKVDDFKDKTTADLYYRQNYSNVSYSVDDIKIKPELSSGWVIQLSAFKNTASILKLSNSYPNFDDLYVAKKLVNGTYWYCLISKVYQEREAAMLFLAEQSSPGLPVEASKYADVVWKKN